MIIKKVDVISKVKDDLQPFNFEYKDDVIKRINTVLNELTYSVDDDSIISQLICEEWKKIYPQFSNSDIFEYTKNIISHLWLMNYLRYVHFMHGESIFGNY